MGYSIIIASLTCIALLTLSTCASREVTSPTPGGQALAPPLQSPVKGWEAQWDMWLQAARKEGTVLVYSGQALAPAMKEATSIFKNKFGINLDVVTGRGAELITKLHRERYSGLYLPDLFFGGLNTIFSEVKPNGVTDSFADALILPDVVDPKVWFAEKVPWQDDDRHILGFIAYVSQDIAVNTDLVKPAEITSYYDLLNPRWKGKIVLGDYSMQGPPFNSFATMILNKVLDLDFYRQLVKQEPLLIRDQRLQMDWVARGKYPLTLAPASIRFSEYREVGAPVAYMEAKEGSYVGSGGTNMALVNKAPHPNAARVFINWVLTREGQLHMQKFTQLTSARVDIPTEGIAPERLRKPGQKYFWGAANNEKWVLYEQDKYLEMAKEVFAPLLK